MGKTLMTKHSRLVVSASLFAYERFYNSLRLPFALLGGTMLSSVAFAQDIGTVDVAIPGTVATGPQRTSAPVFESPGAITQQDIPAANTTIGREQIQRLPASSNYVQDLQYLPGVNVTSKDPTGIFGGSFSIRGFDLTQINAAVDGISQNDPGTGVTLPQIAIDNENICSIKVQESGFDPKEAPAPLGTVGGVIAIHSCAPTDKYGLIYNQSVGSFDSHREFVRFDTGGLLDNNVKGYVSFSNTATDIFYGYGGGTRQHIDSQWIVNTPYNHTFTLEGFWTLQNQIAQRQITLAQYKANGYEGYGNTPPSPVIGTKDQVAAAAPSPAAITTTANQLYYNSFQNPGLWYSVSGKDEYKPVSNVAITVQPYTWFQFSGTNSSYAAYDLTNGFGTVVQNGQTVTLGKVNNSGQVALVSGQGNSRIYRNGVNSTIDWKLGPQTATLGLTFEDIRQTQMTPYQFILPSGNLASNWYDPSSIITLANGQEATGRDWLTHTTILTPSLSDDIKLFDDRLSIDPAIRLPIATRDFTNFPADNASAYEFYQEHRSWTGATPAIGISYDINKSNQVFASISRGFELPTNSIDGNVVNPTTGAIVSTGPTKAETSTDYEAGYRYHDSRLNVQATLYHINFYDRISLVPNTSGGFSSSTWLNVGDTRSNGAELSGTVKATDNLSLFATADYNDSRMNNDVLSSDGTTTFATAGKIFYNSPRFQGAAGAVVEVGAAQFMLATKYTGKVYSTLINDQSLSGYNVVNLAFAYDLKKDDRFADATKWANGAVLSLTVQNLLNARYLQLPSSGNTGPQATAGGNPTYLPGSPLFIGGQIAFKL
jgi:iron complex outermembrane receptor protein